MTGLSARIVGGTRGDDSDVDFFGRECEEKYPGDVSLGPLHGCTQEFELAPDGSLQLDAGFAAPEPDPNVVLVLALVVVCAETVPTSASSSTGGGAVA